MATPAFGHAIRRLRQAKNWSREKLAEKAGVETRTVVRFESGETQSSVTADKLRKALGANHERLEYEVKVHDIIVKAIDECEKEGLSVTEAVLRYACEKGRTVPQQGDPSSRAAEVLENETTSSLARGRVPVGFVASLIEHLAKSGNDKHCHVLTRLVGAVAITLVEPLSIDLDQPVVRMRGVRNGLGIQIALNGHRGKSVSIPYEVDRVDLPRLLEPDNAFELAAPESAEDPENVTRTLLEQIDEQYSFLDSARAPITGDVCLPIEEALRLVDVRLQRHEEEEDALFVYSNGPYSVQEYLQYLVRDPGGLRALKAVHIVDNHQFAALRIDPMAFEGFLQQCLGGICVRRLELVATELAAVDDPDTLCQRMIDNLDRASSSDAKRALEELKVIANGVDCAQLGNWMLRWGAKVSEAGGHIQNTQTIYEKVILPAVEFVTQSLPTN